MRFIVSCFSKFGFFFFFLFFFCSIAHNLFCSFLWLFIFCLKFLQETALKTVMVNRSRQRTRIMIQTVQITVLEWDILHGGSTIVIMPTWMGCTTTIEEVDHTGITGTQKQVHWKKLSWWSRENDKIFVICCTLRS